MGNVVQRDDALYARMKQRDIDAHDSMWEPIFVDDAALGLGDSKNKLLKTFIKRVVAYSAANLFETQSFFFLQHVLTFNLSHLDAWSGTLGVTF